MILSESKPVFIQIKQWIEDHILKGEWTADYQIPSIREMSGKFRVNSNTIVRTYEKLEAEGSVYSVRGVGYFVTGDARDKIMEYRRRDFFQEELPSFLHQIDVLDIDYNIIIKRIKDENEH